MFDLVCDVPRLRIRSEPLVDKDTELEILYKGEHFHALKFKPAFIGKTRIMWAQNTAGKWAMVLHGRALYFKLAGKPFNPPLG